MQAREDPLMTRPALPSCDIVSADIGPCAELPAQRLPVVVPDSLRQQSLVHRERREPRAMRNVTSESGGDSYPARRQPAIGPDA